MRNIQIRVSGMESEGIPKEVAGREQDRGLGKGVED